MKISQHLIIKENAWRYGLNWACNYVMPVDLWSNIIAMEMTISTHPSLVISSFLKEKKTEINCLLMVTKAAMSNLDIGGTDLPSMSQHTVDFCIFSLKKS